LIESACSTLGHISTSYKFKERNVMYKKKGAKSSLKN